MIINKNDRLTNKNKSLFYWYKCVHYVKIIISLNFYKIIVRTISLIVVEIIGVENLDYEINWK